MPLARYKLLVAPSFNVISEALAAKLVAYVRQGGHLLLGPRSGMKDEYNSLNTQGQPGPLVEALGGRVEQYYALEQPIKIANSGAVDSVGGMADTWAEELSTSSPDTAVQLRYGTGNGWLEGKPAMITRTVGKGSITYLGTLPDATLMRVIMIRAASEAQVYLFYRTSFQRVLNYVFAQAPAIVSLSSSTTAPLQPTSLLPAAIAVSCPSRSSLLPSSRLTCRPRRSPFPRRVLRFLYRSKTNDHPPPFS